MEYKSLYDSPFGTIILSSDGELLTDLCFTSSRFIKSKEVKKEQIKDDLEIFKKVKNWLDRYFGGKQPDLNEIPLKMSGSDFSLEVWEVLKTIPYGKTITYGDIAKIIAQKRGLKKMSAQAVGHAVGYNPFSIIIPCHRVIGANGNLTGYGGGLKLKIKLLEHEKADMKGFYIPKKGNAL